MVDDNILSVVNTNLVAGLSYDGEILFGSCLYTCGLQDIDGIFKET